MFDRTRNDSASPALYDLSSRPSTKEVAEKKPLGTDAEKDSSPFLGVRHGLPHVCIKEVAPALKLAG